MNNVVADKATRAAFHRLGPAGPRVPQELFDTLIITVGRSLGS